MQPARSTFIFSLLAVANAAPYLDEVLGAAKKLTDQATAHQIPQNVPTPPGAQCALLVFSSTLLPLGGDPTSVSGEGIGPSDQGSPEVLVINDKREVVGGAVTLATQSPGFAASVQLSPAYINNAGKVDVSAEYVSSLSFDLLADAGVLT